MEYFERRHQTEMAISERGVYFQNEFKRCNFILNQINCCSCICIFLVWCCDSFSIAKILFFFFLEKVSPGKNNFSTEQFGEFKKVLGAMVTNAENNRVMQHLRYIFFLVAILFMSLFNWIFHAHLHILRDVRR